MPPANQAADWLTVDHALLSVEEVALQNNIAALAARQDLYYEIAINKFL